MEIGAICIADLAGLQLAAAARQFAAGREDRHARRLADAHLVQAAGGESHQVVGCEAGARLDHFVAAPEVFAHLPYVLARLRRLKQANGVERRSTPHMFGDTLDRYDCIESSR